MTVGHEAAVMVRPGQREGHVVVAPDKFKGSLTAAQAAAAMATGVRRAAPGLRAIECPVADGGDGTLATVLAAGFERVPVRAMGPTGRGLATAYARKGDVAFVEMAEICGLQRLPDGQPAPMSASSYGLGVVVAEALEHGCRDIVIGIGGSASTDGGAGLLVALGAVALDERGEPIGPGGRGIGRCVRLELGGLKPELADASVTLAADVDNPLCGAHGAAGVYAPQKGATPAQVSQLDAALQSWADVVARVTHTDARAAPGAGAAGGVGFAAISVLNAKIRPGIELVMDAIGLDAHLANATAAITGEGSLDAQSLRGKAAVGVSRRAGALGVPTYAVAGVSALDRAGVAAAGLVEVRSLVELQPDVQRCLEDAAELLTEATEKLVRSIHYDEIETSRP